MRLRELVCLEAPKILTYINALLILYHTHITYCMVPIIFISYVVVQVRLADDVMMMQCYHANHSEVEGTGLYKK